MGRAVSVVYSGLYENETARHATWFVPAAHYLETWGDARAYDGTYSVVQPLVQPLFGGKSTVEVLAALAGEAAADPLAMLRASAKAGGIAADDDQWASVLRRGLAASAPLDRVPMPARAEALARSTSAEPSSSSGTIEVAFAPDARIHDGSFANNGWLQELPDPVTKLTWDNAALLSPATAMRIGAGTGDIIRLAHDSESLQIPALVVPGQPDGLATLHLGYGRTGAEKIASGVGANAYALWPATDEFISPASRSQRASDAPARELAITQAHWTMEGRDQARSETLEQYRAEASKPPARPRKPLTIYDPQQRLESPLQWAMTIDLATCTGCSACVVACQAENNIAGRRSRRCGEVAGDALAAHRSVSGRQPGGSARDHAAHALPALRERAVRVRVSRGRHGAQSRWAQRDGVQPVRGHALLLQQLSVQGAPLQLVRLQCEPHRHASGW